SASARRARGLFFFSLGPAAAGKGRSGSGGVRHCTDTTSLTSCGGGEGGWRGACPGARVAGLETEVERPLRVGRGGRTGEGASGGMEPGKRDATEDLPAERIGISGRAIGLGENTLETETGTRKCRVLSGYLYPNLYLSRERVEKCGQKNLASSYQRY